VPLCNLHVFSNQEVCLIRNVRIFRYRQRCEDTCVSKSQVTSVRPSMTAIVRTATKRVSATVEILMGLTLGVGVRETSCHAEKPESPRAFSELRSSALFLIRRGSDSSAHVSCDFSHGHSSAFLVLVHLLVFPWLLAHIDFAGRIGLAWMGDIVSEVCQ
jgi:hypothetical protein